MAFQGRVALVTGGGSGMGRLACRRLAEQGAAVAALDRDAGGLEETAAGHPGVHTFTADVTSAEAVEDAVKRVEAELGAPDRVLTAAAIMPLGKLLEQERATTLRIMDINYGGTVNVVHATLPGMLERGRGDFVIFASVAGWVPVMMMGAYNASKFATVAYAEVLYHENRDRGVRFACVCPPPVDTPLLDQGRETHWPKILDQGQKPIEPGAVLDAIEASLEKGELFVFPGAGTKLGWRIRRWFPGLVWRSVHRTEGF